MTVAEVQNRLAFRSPKVSVYRGFLLSLPKLVDTAHERITGAGIPSEAIEEYIELATRTICEAWEAYCTQIVKHSDAFPIETEDASRLAHEYIESDFLEPLSDFLLRVVLRWILQGPPPSAQVFKNILLKIMLPYLLDGDRAKLPSSAPILPRVLMLTNGQPADQGDDCDEDPIDAICSKVSWRLVAVLDHEQEHSDGTAALHNRQRQVEGVSTVRRDVAKGLRQFAASIEGDEPEESEQPKEEPAAAAPRLQAPAEPAATEPQRQAAPEKNNHHDPIRSAILQIDAKDRKAQKRKRDAENLALALDVLAESDTRLQPPSAFPRWKRCPRLWADARKLKRKTVDPYFSRTRKTQK